MPPRPTAVIVGVDPGKSTGVSRLVRAGPPEILQIDGDAIADVVGVVSQLDAASSVIVIEDQMAQVYGADKTINFRTLKVLLYRRHVWEILAKVYGVAMVTVYPSTWQSRMLRIASRTWNDGSKKTTKARALQVVAKLWPSVRGWSEHTADAALMAEWYRQKLLADSPEF